ncbi:MAG: rhodanese-like domain-containing protein [Brevirhabdus sp.]
MHSRRQFVLAAACLFLAGPVLAGSPKIISAEDAYAAAKTGEIILLDIRSPGEWKQTGVPEGAMAATMHNDQFVPTLRKLLADNPDTPLAMICATGGRTEYVTGILARNGVDIIDVSEGMEGNRRGKGWVKKGLPLVDWRKAPRP